MMALVLAFVVLLVVVMVADLRPRHVCGECEHHIDRRGGWTKPTSMSTCFSFFLLVLAI